MPDQTDYVAVRGDLPNKHVVDHPDAYLNALLGYTGGFYSAAREAGLSAKVCADAMQHVESAARGLHRKALAAAPALSGKGELRERVEKVIEHLILNVAQIDHGSTMTTRVGAGLKAAAMRDPAVNAILALIPAPPVSGDVGEAVRMAWERLSIHAQQASKTAEGRYLRSSIAAVAGDLRAILSALQDKPAGGVG